MPPVGIPVSYTDQFNIWPHCQAEFKSFLPLRNVELKTLNINPTSLRTNQSMLSSLDLDLQKFNTELWAVTARSNSAFNFPKNGPYLHLYFVNCDEETYKQVIKKEIRTWIDFITIRRNHEWIIVFVSQERKEGQPGMQAGKASVMFDRLKADFNSTRRERCIYVKIDDSSSWGDLFEAVLDGLAFSFGSLLTQAQEDVRKMDAQRMIPGFNFCNFFMLKEGLAEAYECLGLHEEAHLTYHELDAAFFQCVDSAMQKDTTPWSENFGANEAGDDSVDITSSSAKPYQTRIADNTISIFDFRNYSFARQCHLMVRLGRPVEICSRARWHIGMLVRSLRRRQPRKHFLESWVYSACMAVLRLTDWLVNSLNMASNSLFCSRYESVKAALLHEARRQLDVLGKDFGYLKAFDDPLVDALVEHSVPSAITTNQDLLNALQSPQNFCSLYAGISEQLIKIYESSFYQNSVRSLRYDLASLWYSCGRWQEAADLFVSCFDWPFLLSDNPAAVEQFSAGGTTEQKQPHLGPVEISALLKWCRTSLELKNDELYQRQCIILLANHRMLTNQQVENIVVALNKAQPSTEFITSAAGILDFYVDQSIVTQDCILEVRVRSRIRTTPVLLNRLQVVVYGPGGFEVIFKNTNDSGSDFLTVPGSGSELLCRLQCDSSTPAGTYILGSCTAFIGQMQLKASFIRHDLPKRQLEVERHPNAVNIMIDSPSVWRAIESFPDDLAITTQSTTFLLRVYSNSIAMDSGSVVIRLATDNFILLADGCPLNVDLTTDNQRSSLLNIRLSGQAIEIPSAIPAESLLEIAVPFVIDLATPAELLATEFKVNFSLEYRSEKAHGIGMTVVSQNYAMIPLKNDLALRSFVSYHSLTGTDAPSLICYEIKNESPVPIRLLSVKLNDQVGLDRGTNTIIFPGQLHRIVLPAVDQNTAVQPSMQITIDYRRMDEELFEAIYQKCHAISNQPGKLELQKSIYNPTALFAYTLYNFTVPSRRAGEIILREFCTYDQLKLTTCNELAKDDIKWRGRLCAAYGQSSGNWSYLMKYVMKLVSSVLEDEPIIKLRESTGDRLRLLQNQANFFVRNPVADAVTIIEILAATEASSSLTINTPHQFNIRLQHRRRDFIDFTGPLFLDMAIVPDQESWMVVGPVKRRIKVCAGRTVEIPLIFIPLRSGAINLPAIDLVEAADWSGGGENTAILSHEIQVRNHWKRITVLPAQTPLSFWVEDRRPPPAKHFSGEESARFAMASGGLVSNASMIHSHSVISLRSGTVGDKPMITNDAAVAASSTTAGQTGFINNDSRLQTPFIDKIAETPLSAAVNDLLSPAFIRSMTSSLNVRNFRPRRGWWATSTTAFGELKEQMQRAIIDRRPVQPQLASPTAVGTSKSVISPTADNTSDNNIVLQ